MQHAIESIREIPTERNMMAVMKIIVLFMKGRMNEYMQTEVSLLQKSWTLFETKNDVIERFTTTVGRINVFWKYS